MLKKLLRRISYTINATEGSRLFYLQELAGKLKTTKISLLTHDLETLNYLIELEINKLNAIDKRKFNNAVTLFSTMGLFRTNYFNDLTRFKMLEHARTHKSSQKFLMSSSDLILVAILDKAREQCALETVQTENYNNFSDLK